MNKSRVEAFTDAIVAIIMTIMVLELKIPGGGDLQSLLNEKYYFIAYLISFFLIATTWYNHHYIFSIATWISKRAFWANFIWLFFMSLTPVTTAWISKYNQSQTAAYFYFALYAFWAISFAVLLAILIKDNPQQASLLRRVDPKNRSIFELIAFVIGLILIHFLPILCFVILGIEIIVWITFTPKGSDRLTELQK